MKNSKKIFSVSLALVMVLLIMTSFSMAENGYGSNGRFLAPIDPPIVGSVPISNRAELEAIKNNMSGNYHLTADIDLSGAEWAPIGDGDWGQIGYSNPFTGTFDGQGHIIKNLTVTEDYEYAGLFGLVINGNIKNVGLEETKISISFSWNWDDVGSHFAYAGAICGRLDFARDDQVSTVSISNCYNTGSVFVATNNNLIDAYVGGICGRSGSSSGTLSISNCYNTGSISSSAHTGYAGGILGVSSATTGSIQITDCYNTGAVTSTFNNYYSYVGGICGENEFSSIKDCFNSGSVNASTSRYTSYAGGISGENHGGINNCYNTGSILSASSADDSYAGGIFGYGRDYMSPINGENTLNCYNTGMITSSASTSSYAGGICGVGKPIGNCYNTGSISSNSSSRRAYAGGISGSTSIYDDQNREPLSNCYNTGDVSIYVSDSTNAYLSWSFAGGICGTSNDPIINCYNIGSVSANASNTVSSPGIPALLVGGISGFQNQISNCVVLSERIIAENTGIGTPATIYSNLIASQDVPLKTNILAITGISGGAIDDASRRITGAEALLKTTYQSLGWNFDTVWDISPSINSGYPFLKELGGDYTNAATPAIITQPSNFTVNLGSTVNLNVAASVYNGTLSYQWYSNNRNLNTGGTLINGASSATYSAPTSTEDVKYYYCVVTNTDNTVSGNKTATRASDSVRVTVGTPTITITTHPTALTNVTAGSISGSLNVAASVTHGATLSYQWYRTTTNNNLGGLEISGATGSSFSIPTNLSAGAYYYFCEVRATEGAIARRSNVATVVVGSSGNIGGNINVMDYFGGNLTTNGAPGKHVNININQADRQAFLTALLSTRNLNNTSNIYNSIYNLLFSAQYRPNVFGGAEINKWPHQNFNASKTEGKSATDSVLGNINWNWSAWGCASYSYFSSQYIHGSNGRAGRITYKDAMTGAQVKSIFNANLNPGDQILYHHSTNDHSIVYLAENRSGDGFFYLSYFGGANIKNGQINDGNHIIRLEYITYNDFANMLKSDEVGNRLYLYRTWDIKGTANKILIRASCPIDIVITLYGEEINSATNQFTASFGTMTVTALADGKNIEAELDYHEDYEFKIIGTGSGTMDLSVYYDTLDNSREFLNIGITNSTTIIPSPFNAAMGMILDISKNDIEMIDEVWFASAEEPATSPDDSWFRDSESYIPLEVIIDADIAAITWDVIKGINTSQTNVTSNLSLPTVSEYGRFDIKWESSDSAISTNGVVARGNINKIVTLTATITSDNVCDAVTFNLTVPALSSGGTGNDVGSAPSSNNSALSTNNVIFDSTESQDVTVTLTLNGNTLRSVRRGNTTLTEGTHYTVSGNTVTIKAEYLATLEAGEYIITFQMSGGTNPDLTITITDTTPLQETAPTYLVMKPTKIAGTQVAALKTRNSIILGGVEKDFPAVNIDGYNWLKLRDIAMLLMKTSKQFSLSYDPVTRIIDITTGSEYQALGDELEDKMQEPITAIATTQKLRMNGEFIDVAAYNIMGYNYLRLRDLAILLDFAVDYDDSNGKITPDLAKPYWE